MIFSTPSKPIPDETSATTWNVTARVYYDSANDDTTALLTLHRVTSPGVTINVRLEKGRGKSVDVMIPESVRTSLNANT